MIMFSGGVALALCVLLIGFFWPHRTSHSISVSVLGYFLKSIIICWFLFLASFLTNIGSAAAPLSIAGVFGAGVLVAIRRVSFYWPYLPAGRVSIFRSSFFWLAFIILISPALASFGSIFTEWDAVVSWNRWAIELSENKYYPQIGAYPILWPSIWSLIYEAQGETGIWYFAKASVAFPLLFLGFYAAEKIRTEEFFSGVFLCVAIFLFLFTQERFPLSGYMDTPAAILGLVALLLAHDALRTNEKDNHFELLLFASIAASTALITKQSGAMFAALFTIIVIIEFVRKRLSILQFLILAVIIAVPYATYLAIYYERQESIVGNIEILRNLAETQQGGADKLQFALKVLSGGAPTVLLASSFLFALLNLLFLKSVQAWLGLAALLFAAIGVVVFADCCSYNLRNGYWIFSFLIVSSFIGLSSLERKLGSKGIGAFFIRETKLEPLQPAFFLAALGLYGAIMLVLEVSETSTERLAHHQKRQALEVIHKNNRDFLWENKDTLKQQDIIASYFQPIQYTPYAQGRYLLCRKTTFKCIEKAFQIDGVKRVGVFTGGWNEDDSSREFLRQVQDADVAVLFAKLNGFEIILFESGRWSEYVDSQKINPEPGVAK